MPSWLVIVVRSFAIGLSSRASSTSTSAVITSPGRDRRLEAPVDVQEDAAGAGEVLGHDGVQQAGRDAALHDDPAEAAERGGGIRVVVQRVAVAGQLREELDVLGTHAARAAGLVADGGHGRKPRIDWRTSTRSEYGDRSDRDLEELHRRRVG